MALSDKEVETLVNVDDKNDFSQEDVASFCGWNNDSSESEENGDGTSENSNDGDNE